MRQILFILFLMSTQVSMAQNQTMKIGTKSGSKWEEGIAKRMKTLLERHDLSKWYFTDTMVVEDDVIPHSHPVLTISTRKQSNDDLLSVFLHEQIHWHGDAMDDAVKAAIKDFKVFYPEVPVGRPDGAKNEFSSYLHLIVCYLEYKGMVELVGEERAKATMEGMNHYKWIYRQVLDHTDRLAKIVKKHGLDL